MDLQLQAIIINMIILIILIFYMRYDWSLVYANMTEEEQKELEESRRKKEKFIRIALWVCSFSLAYLVVTYLFFN